MKIVPGPFRAFAPPPDAPRWQRLLRYSALARIAWFMIFASALFLVARAAVRALSWTGPCQPPASPWLQFFGVVTPAILAYWLLVRVIEKRRVAELAPRTWVPHGLSGAAVGALECALIVALVWAAGGIVFRGTVPDAPWLANLLVVGLVAGIAEEILSRGVLFRIVEESRGTWLALALSSSIFGVLHSWNPGATLPGTFNVVLAGVVFGLVYHLWRSLPLCMGLHAGWNFTQGQVFGIRVSGHDAPGWIASAPQGPEWLSGGAFGIEASVVTLAVETVIVIALATLAVRRGTVVPWRRPIERPAAPDAPALARI